MIQFECCFGRGFQMEFLFELYISYTAAQPALHRLRFVIDEFDFNTDIGS